MLLITRRANPGCQLAMIVDHGDLVIRTRQRHVQVKIRGNAIRSITEQAGDECTINEYGRGRRIIRAGRTVCEEFYAPHTRSAIRRGGLWQRLKDVRLAGATGTVECFSTASGAYAREVFTYGTGVTAYEACPRRKGLTLYRPDGRRWALFQGRVRLSRSPIARFIDPQQVDLGLSWRMKAKDWDVTVFAADGRTVVSRGAVRDRQKAGPWLERRRHYFYALGVRVSRRIHEGDPDTWDPREVLRIPNAQLRAALLKRLGYERLIEKVQPRVIDSGPDGGQLLEIDTEIKDLFPLTDCVMRMVRVVCPSTGANYVLRVPPTIETFEEARQWGFGIRRQALAAGRRLQLAAET